MEKCEMAGDYEILQAVRLGGKEILLGYNPKDGCAPYMTSYRAVNFLGDYTYPEAIAGTDYLEIMRAFLNRVQEQAKVVAQFREKRNVPIETLGREHCRERGEKEYRTADCQLGFATGGFGCSPGAGGRAVYFEELYSGERCRWEIGDVLGIADPDTLPDWAKEKLSERETQYNKSKKLERGEAR